MLSAILRKTQQQFTSVAQSIQHTIHITTEKGKCVMSSAEILPLLSVEIN